MLLRSAHLTLLLSYNLTRICIKKPLAAPLFQDEHVAANSPQNVDIRQADEQLQSVQSVAICPDHAAVSLEMVMDDQEAITSLNNSLAVLQGPGAADVQQATAKERKANRSIGISDDLMEPSYVHKMNLAVRDDKESYPDLFDNSFSRIGDISELNQPPSVDAVIPMPNMVEACISWDANDSKQQCMQDILLSAPYAAKAPEANAHTDNTTSYNGSHNCLMRIVPISSSSTQSVVCSILSSMEKSSLIGMLLLDEISTAVVKGIVDADAGLNPRDKQCSLNKNEERHPAAGYIAVSFADITKRGIDTTGDDEPGKCAALISMQPITDEDRLAALSRSSCHDEVVGSPAISSSHHVVPIDQHAGEPRSCTSIGKLRRNIEEI
ncbi:hypothetical protein Nepgr_011564 [Nepenthes gracilis]|uniref:Uncharacterized protein n=1 Tax=Nepenthes gracilis TaxID=150966 RepID=A0AAD3SEE9_NEPGR|nr:hypothetical protein Nepgr_011564 [Nepenthes gracilis]